MTNADRGGARGIRSPQVCYNWFLCTQAEKVVTLNQEPVAIGAGKGVHEDEIRYRAKSTELVQAVGQHRRRTVDVRLIGLKYRNRIRCSGGLIHLAGPKTVFN